MKLRIFTTFLLILFSISIAESAELITAEKLMSLKRIGDVALSPDGKNFLITVTTPNIEENNSTSDIFLLSVDGGELKQLTHSGKHNSSPCWSPDSKKVGFISDRNGTPQAFILDLTIGGDAKQLTKLENGVSYLSWSPSGKHLAFVSDVKVETTIIDNNPDLKKVKVRIYTHLPVRHWDEWTDEKFMHLFIISADGGEPTDLMKGEKYETPLKPFGGANQITWSSDGADIAYTSKKVDNFESSTNSDIYTVPVYGGKPTQITKGDPRYLLEGFDMEPLYSPNGSYIAFKSMLRAGFEADKVRLITYALKTARYNDITTKFDYWVDNYIWSKDSKDIYFSAIKEGKSQVFKIDATSGQVETILAGPFNFGDKFLNLSPDGKTLYFSRRSYNGPDEIFKLTYKGKEQQIVQITNINTDALKDIKPAKFEEKIFTTRDNKKVQCWVVYPPDFDPAKKYPMITYCQGGPQQAVSPYWSYGWNFLLMASKGYIILAPNRRGCPGFGQEWVDVMSKDWGGAPMNDLLDATDSMMKETYVDKKKVAAIGGSAGGYTVFWMEGNHNKRFKAFVSHCGVFNVESKHGSTEELWFPNWEFGGTFLSKEAKEQYAKNSPHMFAENWDTPILITTGEKDYRVPYDQSLQAFTLAQVKGIPSELIYYPEENHWITHPQEQIIFYRHFFDFLDKYCK